MYKNWNYSSNKNQVSDDKVEQNKIESNQSEDWLVILYSYEMNDIIYMFQNIETKNPLHYVFNL